MSKILVNKRILKIAIVVAAEILLGIILLCVHSHAKGRKEVLYSQQAAARFSVDKEEWAQISIFYTEEMGLGLTDVKNIRSEVQKKLYKDLRILGLHQMQEPGTMHTLVIPLMMSEKILLRCM